MDAVAKPVHPRRRVKLDNLYFTLQIQGDYVQLHGHQIECAVVPTIKRGLIHGFSRASRLRMLSMIARMDWRAITRGLFITLTFPDATWPSSVEQRNRWRYLFLRHMEKHLDQQIGALWRCEWQERQSGRYKGKLLPHFHLVIPGVKYIHHAKIRKWWSSILGQDGPVATDVRRLSDRRMHEVYIAKYCAKCPNDSSLDYVAYLNTPGRQWGVHRKTKLPFHQEVTFETLTEETVATLRQMAKDRLPYYDPAFDAGFRLFGRNGAAVAQQILQLALDAGSVPVYAESTKRETSLPVS